MADRFWYVARDGKQEGPYPDTQFRGMIATGMVGRATLVWSEGMTDWTNAGDIPGLIPASVRASPPTVQVAPLERVGAAPAPSASALVGQSSGAAFEADFGVWGLLGRSLLAEIGLILIIPAPWAITYYYRWLIAHMRVPGRSNLAFEGKPGDIWYILALMGLCVYGGLLGRWNTLVIVFDAFLAWMTLRWVITNISSEGRRLSLSFGGSWWAYIGWQILLTISFITIIGWAWVTTAWMRWICQNIEGTTRGVSFAGTGWQVLWRTVAFALSAIFIIPIPWTLRWYARWFVSQFRVGDAAGF